MSNDFALFTYPLVQHVRLDSVHAWDGFLEQRDGF